MISSLRAYATLAAAAAARDALSAELARARQLQAALDRHALVLRLDAQGRIVDVNERLCAIAGMRREQLIGRDLHALHGAPFDEAQAGEIGESLAREGAWAGDIRTTTPDGAALALRCTVVASGDAGGYVAVATQL